MTPKPVEQQPYILALETLAQDMAPKDAASMYGSLRQLMSETLVDSSLLALSGGSQHEQTTLPKVQQVKDFADYFTQRETHYKSRANGSKDQTDSSTDT